MFVDFRDQPPPPPWRPAPSGTPRKLTPREEKTLTAIIGANLLLLIVAPIGGATLLQFLAALFR